MTRSNELQQLDADLAAGRLSAEDHRRRRDELVRDTAGDTASPFPPAFRWETSPPEAMTQVMAPVPGDDRDDMGRDRRGLGGRDPAEVTQLVHSGDVHDAQRAPTLPRPSYQASPAYQEGSGQVRGLFQPMGVPPASNTNDVDDGIDDFAPPWAKSDLVPSAENPIADPQSAWMRQGPQAFEASGSQSRSKQIIGIAVLAVLVAGLLGAGVGYFLSGSGTQRDQPSIAQPGPSSSEPTADARQLPAPPAPKSAPVDTAQALIEPPGEARGGGGLLDLPRLESADLLPQPIVNALRAGAMTDGVLKTTTDGANTIGVFAFTVADEQAATDVVNTIATVQRDGGLKVDASRAQQGLAVLGSAPGSRSIVYRGVYVLYNRAIFLEVFGPDYDAVLATFDSVVNQQLTYAPPTVRGR